MALSTRWLSHRRQIAELVERRRARRNHRRRTHLLHEERELVGFQRAFVLDQLRERDAHLSRALKSCGGISAQRLLEEHVPGRAEIWTLARRRRRVRLHDGEQRVR